MNETNEKNEKISMAKYIENKASTSTPENNHKSKKKPRKQNGDAAKRRQSK